MPAFHIPLAAAYVIITAATGIIWSSLVWLIRLFVRLKIRGPFGWDDTLCTIATILAIINSSIVIRQSHYGLGQHIGTLSPALIEKQQLLSWIAGLLYILALCFAMLSICCLIIRITTHTGQGWIAKTIAAVGIIWAVVAFFLIAFICKLPHPWITRPLDRCVDIYHAWMGIAIVNSLLDVANIVAAVIMLWGLRIRWREKALVFALFALRLLVIPPTLIRLKYLKISLESSNWTYVRVDVVLVTQIVLHLSMILTTVPCMKPYLNAFSSGAYSAPVFNIRKQLPASRDIELLPVAQPRPVITRRSTSTGFKTLNALANLPGRAGHRRRMEEWPLSLSPVDPSSSTTTTIEFDPVEAKAAERRRSKDSVGNKGITRTQSFSVKHEDLEEVIRAVEAGGCPGMKAETPPLTEAMVLREMKTAPAVDFEDVGGLLAAKDKGTDKDSPLTI